MLNGHCAKKKKKLLGMIQNCSIQSQLVQHTNTLVNGAHKLYLRQYILNSFYIYFKSLTSGQYKAHLNL